MQDIGMLLWQGLGPYIHNSQYVPPLADQPVSSAELKKLRTPVRARFTKAFNELETEIKNNEVKKADVEKILRRLQTHYEKLSILNMRMEEALLRESASEDIITAEYESVCEYEDNISNIMTDYEALAEKDDVSTISGTAAMNYRLPKLEFKKFGGEPREWITFWSQFSTIDRDPQMPPETKFQYLFEATAENPREIEVEKKKKTDVAQKHNIPQSSLSTIIKNSEKIHQQALHAGESSRKRARGSTYADVDEALLQWFKQARSAALPVNGPLLSEKAKTLALEFGLKDFTGSGGWIERWKARHGIKLRNICGESADVNRETMTNWLTDVMPNIISNYACKDIFNADETGLFWRLLPDKTLHFKGETCTGGKASKERITILLCCNMDGSEKMQPLVIGKAKQPRCFRGIKHLPVQYEANQKAWMTGLLFESWVRHIDKKMAGQHRQIILLLDNCGAHPPDMQGLTNTRIAFLPPNTTSMLQPCDQGIIRNFKMIYRTRLMRKYLTAYDAGTALTINLKQAVDIISVAWNDVLPATIYNCWHHSGIIKSDVSSPLDTPQPATQMWEQQSLFDRMKEV
ncbi:TIGD4 [Cordylochernes scorpioides]|uniref:TIGD4 n=1 Tax=Cordylochernes scorpioides TaxID=51811 RepID=A0ABY6LFT9_9ARAC|nr:TIGD4 [Cordylochernes scorpioides]